MTQEMGFRTPSTLQHTFGRDRGDEDSDGGPDERGGVSDGAEALALDEGGDLLGEGPEVRLHVVLEDDMENYFLATLNSQWVKVYFGMGKFLK